MSVQRHRVRPGTYCDSVVLMQLQRALEREPGVEQAAAVMATPANREILENGEMWSADLAVHRPDDLLIVVRAADPDTAETALERIDDLLRQRAESRPTGHRYRSLAKALEDHPEAGWVAISTPGAHAAPIAREALAAGRHVFLYSDNVPLDDEVALKEDAGRRGRLVLGPDCGTSILGGLGFGFSNRVRRGPIGLVGASGTGLQAVSCRIDTLGSGISHAIGTGGRDLSARVAARTTRQALELLSRDPNTRVLGLISKPPDPAVATDLIAYANSLGKPVVVGFVGGGSSQDLGRVELASSLSRTAERLVARLEPTDGPTTDPKPASGGRLEGLFSGGTLALEIAGAISSWLAPLETNLGIGTDCATGTATHRILDLGADEFTVGRPHPMIDDALRLDRLHAAAADGDVGTLLLDVVLGDGAQSDPAADLAPAIQEARNLAQGRGRELRVGILLIGSDQDPQDRDRQQERLIAAGATVLDSVEAIVRFAADGLLISRSSASLDAGARPPVDLSTLQPTHVINVGLDSFVESFTAQGADVIAVDWRPPAGGDDRLAQILRRMKGTNS